MALLESDSVCGWPVGAVERLVQAIVGFHAHLRFFASLFANPSFEWLHSCCHETQQHHAREYSGAEAAMYSIPVLINEARSRALEQAMHAVQSLSISDALPRGDKAPLVDLAL